MNLRRQGETDSVSEIESVWMSRTKYTCLRQLQCSKEMIGVDMTQDCQDITVHAVNFDHRGGPAFYASLPGDGETVQKMPGKRGRRQESPGLLPVGSSYGDGKPPLEMPLSLDRAAFPVHVIRDPLGRPICCWENIGVRPSPSVRAEGKSGPRFVGMHPISASM